MVKNIYRTVILLTIITSAAFIFSCSNDLFGFVASTDLDERLKSKNDFPFLDARGWRESPPTIGNEYKFIVVTDTHIENGNDYGLSNLPDAIKKHEAKFAVILGDITQAGTEHDIIKFIEIADSLGTTDDGKQIPFYPVIGNHDFYFGNWPVWRDNIGSTNYRIDIKDGSDYHTTLLILDSANAFFGKRQLDWLETQIKTAHKNVFVFTHSPLFTSGIKMQQITDTREIARVAHILRDKADIMFSGHSHQRVENKTGNVQYVTFEDFKTSKTYIVVDVKSNGSINYSFDKL